MHRGINNVVDALITPFYSTFANSIPVDKRCVCVLVCLCSPVRVFHTFSLSPSLARPRFLHQFLVTLSQGNCGPAILALSSVLATIDSCPAIGANEILSLADVAKVRVTGQTTHAPPSHTLTLHLLPGCVDALW